MNVVDDVFVDLLLKLLHRGLVLRKELVGFSVSLSKSSAWLQRTKPIIIIIIIIIIIRQFIRRRNMSESLQYQQEGWLSPTKRASAAKIN